MPASVLRFPGGQSILVCSANLLFLTLGHIYLMLAIFSRGIFPWWFYICIPMSKTPWSPIIRGFTFCNFSYPWSTAVQKYWVETFRNQQLSSFQLCTVLNSMLKWCATFLAPARDISHPFVWCIPPISHLVASWVTWLPWYRSACAQVTFIFLNNGPQMQKEWCWSGKICQRSCTEFPSSLVARIQCFLHCLGSISALGTEIPHKAAAWCGQRDRERSHKVLPLRERGKSLT